MCMDVHYNMKPYFRLIPHHDGQWAKTLLRKPQSLMEIGEFNIKWLFFHAFIHITKRISVANIYENLLQICSSNIMAFWILRFSFGSDYNSGITEFFAY